MSEVMYETVESVEVDELAAFYDQQHHHRPESREKLARMIEQSRCFVTARKDGRLIGIARGTTDGVRGQLAECKLDPAFQGPAAVTRVEGRIEHDSDGIAHEMARRVIEALRAFGVEDIHVLCYGTEADFCEEMGFKKMGGVVAMKLDVATQAQTESAAAMSVAAE